MNTLTVFSSEIRQLDGLYSLNDLHKAAGGATKHRPTFFLRLDTTQELATEIRCADSHIIPIKTVRGRGKPQGTYVCKELVYAYAMWISPLFHLKVIRAFDALQQPVSATYNWPTSIGSRFIVSFGDNGTQHVKPIPHDAYVLTRDQFVRAVGCCVDFPLSTAQLAQVIEGASSRLHRILSLSGRH